MKKLVRPILVVLDSLYKYLIAAVLIFIPLYPKFPLFTVPFTYVAIRAEDFLITVVWAVFILRSLLHKKFRLPSISTYFVVFLFIGLVSSLSAILVTKNIQPLIVLLHYFRRIEYMSMFFLIYWAARDQSSRRYYLELAIIPSIGVLLYGIAQIYFGAPVISTMDSESSKGIALTLRPGVMLSSTFAGHYDLAVYLTMMMTFLAAVASQTKKIVHRLPLLFLFVALLWLFMQAGSRIGLPSLIFAVAFVTFSYRRYLLGLFLTLIIFGFIATSPQYIVRFQSIFNSILRHTSSIITPVVFAAQENEINPSITPTSVALPTPIPVVQDISTSIRFNVEWPRAIRAFLKNPIFGTGYSSITLATDNDFLRTLGETGLLGLLSFLALLIILFRTLLDLSKHNTGVDRLIAVSATGVFIAFLTTAVFIDVFESSKIAILFWTYMGLALSTQIKS